MPDNGEKAFTEAYFNPDAPAEEKIAEVYKFCEQLGFTPERALIRIFNGGLVDAMQASGTDRAGIDDVDTRRYSADEGFGYAERLQSKGLKLEDGLYAIPLNQWAPVFTAGLFEHETLSIPSFRTAIAVYDGNKMLDIFSDQPASEIAASGPAGEFYYFKDPTHKHDALAGVLVQSSSQIETVFQNLSSEDKVAFIRELLPGLNKENQDMIQQFILDMNRDTRRELHTAQQVNNAESQQQLNQLQQQIDALSTDCLQRRSEIVFLDTWNGHLDLLRKFQAEGREPRGTSVEFVAQHIREELKQEIREDYREKVLQLFGELQAIGDPSPSQDKQKQQIAAEEITTDTSPQTSSDPIEKIIDFAKKLPAPEQHKENKTLDQNDITGSKGLGKPQLPPGKSPDDTSYRS